VSVKLLFDANLSWRLVKLTSDIFIGSNHVDSIGLSNPAKDREIWEYAKKHDYVIVTNDDDFYEFAVVYGIPPYIVILRTGNQSTRFVSDVLHLNKEKITQLVQSTEFGILEIY
jgi:predicted nuclease of predicted toxin-antitoxin system